MEDCCIFTGFIMDWRYRRTDYTDDSRLHGIVSLRKISQYCKGRFTE